LPRDSRAFVLGRNKRRRPSQFQLALEADGP